jgi:hypothetical protein
VNHKYGNQATNFSSLLGPLPMEAGPFSCPRESSFSAAAKIVISRTFY